MTPSRAFRKRGGHLPVAPALVAASLALLACAGSHGWAAPTPGSPSPASTLRPDRQDLEKSFVRIPVTVPLRAIREAIDREVPVAAGTRDRFVPFESELEIRYSVRRDPIQLEARRDTLVARAAVHYWLDARGPGFKPVACGSRTEPLDGEIGCWTRIGWGDDWQLDARSASAPTIHARRCKPVPPGINFTRVMSDTISRGMVPALATAVEATIVGSDHVRRVVETGWRALQTPLDLGQGLWLDFGVQRVLAGPLVTRGDSIVAEVHAVVAPRIRSGAPRAAAAWPLPDARVRLAGDDFQVAFDCEVPFESLSEDVMERWASESVGGDALDLRRVRMFGRGHRIFVALEVTGSAHATLQLSGTPAYDPLSHTLAVPDLHYTPETARALRDRLGKVPPQALERLRSAASEALRVPIGPDIAAAVAPLGRALNRRWSAEVSARGGINERRLLGTYVTAEAMGAHFVAVGRATLIVE
ncbi:MAG TPA: DUF4403 family protein [Candidatus Limnocylindria bacterium]|nr:DUF4403 family protein [Candidatus Limnocylindria bacterium]